MTNKPTPVVAPKGAAVSAKQDGEALAVLEEGVRQYIAGDLVAAHASFAKAHARAMNVARLMSWHGLTLVLVEHNSNLGVLYCEEALRHAGPEAELLLNLARVYLALGQRDRAVRAVQRGLERAPENSTLKLAQETMGWRRKPVFPFLERDNLLNHYLGMFRHRVSSRKAAPATEATAARLGLPPIAGSGS